MAKILAAAMVVFAAMGTGIGALMMKSRSVAIVPESRPAAAQISSAPTSVPTSASTGTLSVTVASSTVLATITPGLLPKVSFKGKFLPIAQAPAATSTTETKARTTEPPRLPENKINSGAITAQWILDHTKTSLQETLGGMYELTFTTAINGTPLAWNLLKTQFGGAGGIPPFTAAFSCNPPGTAPVSDALDQNPRFNILSSYTCTVSLTANAGDDRRTYSKDFAFTTPAGELAVSPVSSMNTILANDENDGGFVFTNTDPRDSAITGVTFDVSYNNLSTTQRPLVLRFLNPADGTILYDYHMENLPETDPSTFAHGATGVNAPLSFTIKGSNQKLLPVQILGVTKMLIAGSTPRITVTLTGISTGQSNVKTVFHSAKISWHCVVASGAYDPNATSGPYATGEACQN